MSRTEEINKFLTTQKQDGEPIVGSISKIDGEEEKMPNSHIIANSIISEQVYKNILTQPIPKIDWDEVFENNDIKQNLLEYIVLPLKFPQLFANYRLRNILLYGVFF